MTRPPSKKVEAAWATFRPTMTTAELVERLMSEPTNMTRAQAERHAAKCITTDHDSRRS